MEDHEGPVGADLEHHFKQRAAELAGRPDVQVGADAAGDAGVVELRGMLIVVHDGVDDVEPIDAVTGGAVRPHNPFRCANKVAHKSYICVLHI